ncbi:hypothetical protein EIN_391480 [Entamoeba invadens IP1]|uniref:Uncharacterized protein n=1 Tax=Entamoeba invadens IP1 TaxID=370355 RepID=A0A0A1U8S6_ENTIV|nr:hypothetical protein EIN_391480 [Entamoeba invadens IP1]ELP89493.1 hypothetical protein EIN_391480 [Entamoeba invadens IP1]|eukprot:XP_004256264.1 hypothetical protein EIN_391480 [Entamoeba invadens IP1]
MSEEQNVEIKTWKEVEEEWSKSEENDTKTCSKKEYEEYYPLFVQYATQSPQHRFTLFQIYDSLKYLCQTTKEFNILFWRYLTQVQPFSSRDVVPVTLPPPESEKCFFNLELKFQQNKICIEFHSELALFRDRDIPSNTVNRHATIQGLFNDKISALVLSLARYNNSTQVHIKNLAKYDVLFGSYEDQEKTVLGDENKSLSCGDFYVTKHSNLFYNLIVHCKFDQPFVLENPEEHQRFYSNLIFYLHRCKTQELFFCMHELDTSELPKRITSVFSAVRQAILYDGYTSLQKIVFICPDTDLNLKQLKDNFDSTFLN